jgi:catechol 2,3-dioxygenase-like lactoylglutathione lyase family enzyme
MHVNVGVTNLDDSIRFYSSLFGTHPTVVKRDYAKWMLDDPRVNFAITTHGGRKGIDHLGIQVETRHELDEVYGRLKDAESPLIDQGAVTCCYAKSEKT